MVTGDHSMVTMKLVSSPMLHSIIIVLYMWPTVAMTCGSNPRSNTDISRATLKNYSVDVALMLATNGADRLMASAVSNVLSTSALLTTVRGPYYAIILVAMTARSSLSLLLNPEAMCRVKFRDREACDRGARVVLLLLFPLGNSRFALTWTIIKLLTVRTVSPSYVQLRTSSLTLKK